MEINIEELLELKRKHLRQEQMMLTHFMGSPREEGYHAGRICEIRDMIEYIESIQQGNS